MIEPIVIKVTDKVPELVSGPPYVVCDNSDYTVVWQLDEEWAQFEHRTMQVNYKDGTYERVLFTGNGCALPAIPVKDWFFVGLFAGDIHTSRPLKLFASRSVTTDSGEERDPTPDGYAQAIKALDAKLDKNQGAENAGKALVVDEEGNVVPSEGGAGADGKSAYEIAVENGFEGDEAAWLASLKGADGKPGADGTPGANGKDGTTPTIGSNGNWYLGTEDTGNPSRGEQGVPGKDGTDGKDGAPGKDGAGMDITGASVGQIAKITAVDDSGKPTAWEAVDMATGGDEWEVLQDVMITADESQQTPNVTYGIGDSGVYSIEFDKDASGADFSVDGFRVFGIIKGSTATAVAFLSGNIATNINVASFRDLVQTAPRVIQFEVANITDRYFAEGFFATQYAANGMVMPNGYAVNNGAYAGDYAKLLSLVPNATPISKISVYCGRTDIALEGRLIFYRKKG